MRLLALVLVACFSLCAEPRRIISTAPGITEIIFALGLGDRLVGATEYCVYPEAARKVPRTGSWMSPNMEAILAARPDLIIVQKTAIHSASKFDTFKLKTLEVQLLGIDDIYATIERIGEVAGVPDRAKRLSVSIRGELASIRSKLVGSPRTSAMFIVGRAPGSLEGIVGVGKDSYQTQVMEIAGGRNVFDDSKVAYPKILHEEILARDPAVIIDMGEHADASGLTEGQKGKEFALWASRFPKLKAVQSRRVYPVSSAVFVVPGPRVTQLAKEFAKMLHPEAFR